MLGNIRTSIGSLKSLFVIAIIYVPELLFTLQYPNEGTKPCEELFFIIQCIVIR